MMRLEILVIVILNICFINAQQLLNSALTDQFDSASIYVSSNDKACQSGLREDNTNYIYCARQNLSLIPNFSSNNYQLSNVLYDELVLSDNQITRIDADTFSLSFKVKKLYLDSNPIKHIDPKAFDHIRNYLEEIYFDYKQAEGEVKSLAYDEEFDAASNERSQIITNLDDSEIFEESIYKSCFNLRVLSIKSYFISKLNGFKFQKLNKLEILTLSNLKLKYINDDAFVGLEKSLTELNLDSNYLELVPSDSLDRLKRLKRLSLSQNRIKHLHSNAFFRVTSLNTLDLSYNFLNRIDENAFNGPIQNSLKSIQLQNNELKWAHFMHLLFNLHLLQELNIDFNKLSSVNPASSLSSANPSNKSSSLIFLSLNSLSMQGNSLNDKSLEMFSNTYDYYQLMNTNMELMNDTTQNSLNINKKRFMFTSLTKLNLARNKIKQFPDKFFQQLNMTQLKTLVLDRNTFQSENFNKDTFQSLENTLTAISLNNAGLNVLSNSFLDSIESLVNLESLKLNNNKNSVFGPGSISKRRLGLKKLTNLELQNTNLNELPKFMCDLESLSELDVSSNNLREFKMDCLLSESSKLKQINLNNNPLKCDCKFKNLKNWLMISYNKDLLDLTKWKCAEPFELRGRYLSTIDPSELVCEADRPPETSTTSTTSSTTISYSTSTTSTTSTTTTTTRQTRSSTRNVFTRKLILKTQQESLQSSSINPYDINFISLVIGVVFGLTSACLIILITFYILCIRNKNDPRKKQPGSYFNDILNTNTTRYEEKRFCSPLSSTSSSSASTTFSKSNPCSSISNTTQLVDLFSNDYLNQINRMNHASNNITFMTSTDYNYQNQSSIYHNYYDSNNRDLLIVNGMKINNNNNTVKEKNNPTITNDVNHIYHEINTPSISGRELMGPEYMYENNLNYLSYAPNQQFQQQQHLVMNLNNTNNINSNSNFLRNILQNNNHVKINCDIKNSNLNNANNNNNNLLNDFTNSLIV